MTRTKFYKGIYRGYVYHGVYTERDGVAESGYWRAPGISDSIMAPTEEALKMLIDAFEGYTDCTITITPYERTV